jgi:hypothetical protein
MAGQKEKLATGAGCLKIFGDAETVQGWSQIHDNYVGLVKMYGGNGLVGLAHGCKKREVRNDGQNMFEAVPQ